LAQAHAAYSPVVAIAGMLSTAHTYRDAFQEVDQQALFRPITKKTWTLTSASRIPEMMQEAFRTALAPRRGPVALNMPRDMLAETIEVNVLGRSNAPPRPAGDSNQIERAADLLAGAKRPLIIAGGGVKNGRFHKEVLSLAELLSAPVATSPGHGDAIPCMHELYAGQVGPRGNVVASALAREADVILALGTRLGFNTTFYSWDNLNRGARIIQVEIEPTAIGRFFPVETGILGDVGLVVSALETVLRGRILTAVPEWTTDFQRKRRELLAEREAATSKAEPIQPASLFRALRACLPEDTMFTSDAGTLCLQATDQMLYRRPPGLFSPLDFGLVGFSFACGLGVKLACPARTVVSFMGDGGFGMTSSELGTAVANKINTICIVLNNGCWGAEKAYQRDFFNGRYIGADIPNPPYDKLAELWGARGFRVDRIEQVEAAVNSAVQCGKPAVIDIHVDPNALFSFRRDSFKHRDKGVK
jgi:thiamine pyrophosphate-dependent acetolactate synthase large subunit-like protein